MSEPPHRFGNGTGRRPRASSLRRGVRGFTLIELLVVMALLVLLLTAAAPRLGAGSSRTEALAAVRTVVSALRATRSAALGAGDGARLILDVNAHTLQVPGERRPRTLPGHLQIALLTAKSELRGDGVGAVRFFPDGSSTGARVRLEGAAGAWIVDVSWLTGAIASRELSGEEAAASDEAQVAWARVASQ